MHIIKSDMFNIRAVSYFNYILFLPILIIRCIQRFRLILGEWGVYPVVKSRFVNSWLTWIFKLDIISIENISPPFGVSLMLTAQKRSAIINHST